MLIRRAKRVDRPRMFEMIHAFSPLDAELARRDLKGEMYVAVDSNMVVGMAGIIPDTLSPRACWLAWTYFDPQYRPGPHGPGDPFRGFHVWAALLHRMEEIAVARGKLLFITSSTHPAYAHAIAFYQRHGYVIAGTLDGFYSPEIDLVALCRRRQGPSSKMMDGIVGTQKKLLVLQTTLDAFAQIFREYGVITDGMAPEQCTRSLLKHLDDARKYRELNVAPTFSDALKGGWKWR